jgi:hypothetical protein
MVRFVSGWRVDSSGLWSRVVAEVVEVVGRIGYVAVMVADDMGSC